ncbi:MAG: ABC transporter permease [Aureispira sp.]|nr:ABC transporter permease [Aureispira sp.]
MFDLDKWQEIIASLSKHKLRTGLTAFGVFWGIFMLVLLLGAGNGLQNGAEYEFRDDATNSLWIYPRRTSMAHNGLASSRNIEFDNSDYDLLKDKVEGTEHITGRFFLPSELEKLVYNNVRYNFSVRCVHPDHQILENTIVEEGRYLNALDLKSYRKVAVIGTLVVEEVFPNENPIGKYVQVGGISFQIVGVFSDTGGDDEMRMVYLPITTAQRCFDTKNTINQIMLTTGDAKLEEVMAMEQEVIAKLAAKHNFDPNDKQAIRIRNRVEHFQSIMNLFKMISYFIWVVGVGSIIAGVIGVSNIMLIVVKDRTKEIGIRKALGATPFSVVSMILQEAVLITSVAGYLGMALGIGLIHLIRITMNAYEIDGGFFKDPQVDAGMVVFATIIVVIAGAIAGLIPALKAAKISPVEAMR